MSDRRIVLQLNQQQIELLDKTIAKGEAADRASLARRALREYAARHAPSGRPPVGAERRT